MQISEDLFLGSAQVLIPPAADQPSPTTLGVGPLGRVYIWDVVPATLGTALLAALQTTAGAADLVLTAGAGVTLSQNLQGQNVYALDCPRCLTLTSAGNISAVTFTIYGYDQYGQPMTQALAGPNANTVATTKAFKSIYRVAVSAAVGTTTSVGFNDKLGCPFLIPDLGYIVSVKWAGAFASDAGTAVAGDATSPATAATTDVRGCYTPSSASNGVRRLVMCVAMRAIAAGPQATRLGAVGVTQA